MAKRIKRKKRNYSKLIFILALVVIGALIATFLFNSYKNKTKVACANSISCIKDLSGNYEQLTKGVFMGKVVDSANYLAQEIQEGERLVLGESTGEEKHIYVDLSSQRLYAYEGRQLVYSFPVSTGKWGLTPTGDFRIWIKLRYTRMAGGDSSIGTYYNLPNVPYTMFYYNNEVSRAAGYSLHGAYWHNNFGHPMSHGCVNIAIEDAGKLYYWANPPTSGNTTYASAESPGTLVTVYGQTPAE